MTDRKVLADQNETPEDVATLYSWANLHGAKYRDFSASRAQMRESARQRAQEAIEEERRRAFEQAELERQAEEQREAQAVRAAEAAQLAQVAAQQAALQAGQQAAEHAAQLAARRAAQEAEAAREAARQQAEAAAKEAAQKAADDAARRAAEQAAMQAAKQAELAAQQAAQNRGWQLPAPDRFSARPSSIPAPQGTRYYPPPAQQVAGYRDYGLPPVSGPGASPPQPAPMHEESFSQPRNLWEQAEAKEAGGRPAWLSDRVEFPNQPLPQAPEDTLQGSRDRLTSRWFALKGVFAGANSPAEAVAAPAASRAPSIAVFSLAGGVGKTSLVATLGRALSARGERVLLVDTAAYGLLPFFFGATDQRPGVLRTFSPPGAGSDASVQMITFDPEAMEADAGSQDALVGEISKCARGVSRVIVDLATASGATTRRVMRMSPLVLVPVVPDMNSVVSVSSIESFFQNNRNSAGSASQPYYVLNQFDSTLPLHLDVREVLREQLGDRLLPFALRRAPAVSEALAEGMTVMDYAPSSTVAEDFGNLVGWVKSVSAPSNVGYRGVRWSER